MSNQHLQQSQKVKYSNETINETSNSSTTNVQEKSNNGSAKKSSDSTRKIKKKSDLSESRERFNNIRYFYADPEIDKAAERPLVRLNPMTMFYMGVSDDNSHLLQSANYLRNELPIRLAHMIKELRNLPFIVACNPSMLEIHERCIKAFRNFDSFQKDIKDINTEKEFNILVFEMLEMNKDLLSLLCDGFKDTRRYIKNESFIKANLNKILSARLGLRLLCEHHIALNKQSNLNKLLLSDQDMENYDDNDESPSDHNNHNNNQKDFFNSSYLAANSGDSNNSGNKKTSRQKDSNLIGIIHKKFSPRRLIETSGRMVTRICTEKYGTSPKIKIDGHTSAQFPYLPLPLEYILPELLKNAFRATYEHHRNSPTLPDVSVTIAVNDKTFVIRIRDRGGGIPHELVDKIFDYHFTTASSDASLSDQTNGVSSKDLTNDLSFNNNNIEIDNELDIHSDNLGMGMVCEASSSRGLAIMHGYGFGLPTSKAYAEYLGGSLKFQTMQGIGTDFYLRLGRLDIEPEMNLFQELLQKPIEYCSVQLQPGQIIAFGGSHEPCAFIQLCSIGRLGPKGNLVHSEKIMTEFENTLVIYSHLTYIHFIDLKPTGLDCSISGLNFWIAYFFALNVS